jgi:putative ABC transport system permease protein
MDGSARRGSLSGEKPMGSDKTIWVRYALANLFRNKRRSLYTVLAIAMGYAAINVFGGFTSYIFTNLKASFIYVDANGHLSIFKKGFLTEGKIDPTRFLITNTEFQKITRICSEIPGVVVAAPQLQITGLISNGEVSTIFIGMGRVPSQTRLIQQSVTGMISRFELFDGDPLTDDRIYGGGITYGLGEKLGLEMGSSAIVMAPTVEGRINALDMEIRQKFKVPVEVLNDMVISIPLAFAQSLYDTDSVGSLSLLLSDDSFTLPVRESLQQIFLENGLDMEVKTWEEMAPFYSKVKNMFDIIFLLVFIIVLAIAVTSVINTLSMTVMERIREIGTLRALGMKRSGVVTLFAMESAMLGVAGSLAGMGISFFVWIAVKLLEPQWMPPNFVDYIPLEVYLVPAYLAVTLCFLVILSVIASIIPARKAARGGIVDALGHV